VVGKTYCKTKSRMNEVAFVVLCIIFLQLSFYLSPSIILFLLPSWAIPARCLRHGAAKCCPLCQASPSSPCMAQASKSTAALTGGARSTRNGLLPPPPPRSRYEKVERRHWVPCRPVAMATVNFEDHSGSYKKNKGC